MVKVGPMNVCVWSSFQNANWGVFSALWSELPLQRSNEHPQHVVHRPLHRWDGSEINCLQAQGRCCWSWFLLVCTCNINGRTGGHDQNIIIITRPPPLSPCSIFSGEGQKEMLSGLESQSVLEETFHSWVECRDKRTMPFRSTQWLCCCTRCPSSHTYIDLRPIHKTKGDISYQKSHGKKQPYEIALYVIRSKHPSWKDMCLQTMGLSYSGQVLFKSRLSQVYWREMSSHIIASISKMVVLISCYIPCCL